MLKAGRDLYLQQLMEGRSEPYSEYDDVQALNGLVRDGLAIWDPDYPNRADNFICSLKLLLTETGRAEAAASLPPQHPCDS